MRAAIEPSTPAAGDLRSLHQVGCTSLAFSYFELSKKVCCLFLIRRRRPVRLSDDSANASGFTGLVPRITLVLWNRLHAAALCSVRLRASSRSDSTGDTCCGTTVGPHQRAQ